MSLVHALSSLPPYTLTLGATTLVSAYPFLFNFADYQRGVVSALNGRLGPTYLTPRSKARIFAGYFDNAARWVVGSTTLAAGLAFTTAYLAPSPIITQLALASGIFSSLQIPATIALGIPKLFGPVLKFDREDALKDVPAGSAKGNEVDKLIQDWEAKHVLRFGVTGPAFALALLALMLDGRV